MGPSEELHELWRSRGYTKKDIFDFFVAGSADLAVYVVRLERNLEAAGFTVDRVRPDRSGMDQERFGVLLRIAAQEIDGLEQT